MDSNTAALLGPNILEGIALADEVQKLGVVIDDQTDYPEAVHVVMPHNPNERTRFIFKDDRLSERLSMFLAAKYGTFNVCFHAPNCTCGYSAKRSAVHGLMA